MLHCRLCIFRQTKPDALSIRRQGLSPTAMSHHHQEQPLLLFREINASLPRSETCFQPFNFQTSLTHLRGWFPVPNALASPLVNPISLLVYLQPSHVHLASKKTSDKERDNGHSRSKQEPRLCVPGRAAHNHPMPCQSIRRCMCMHTSTSMTADGERRDDGLISQAQFVMQHMYLSRT